MSIWWSLHLRREAASVPLARRMLLGTMEAAGVDPEISYEISVALSEACANAVEHGGDTARGESAEAYQVTAYLDGEMCRIEVADSGPGFPSVLSQPLDSSAKPSAPLEHGGSGSPYAGRFSPCVLLRPAQSDAEHGRGLCLIQALADHVHIGNKSGRGGAVVSFDKVLKWREDAPLVAV